MITYFKSQLTLTEGLIAVIDDYWNLKINETEFILYIGQVSENNKQLLFKNGNYVSIVKQRLGVKRLDLLDRILKRK